MNLRSSSCSGEDRISNLSDSLIHHILSFIDTKYAVQTCVLSKRWSEIWISLPFLNFNRSLYLPEEDNVETDDYVGSNRGLSLTNFVRMVFYLRDNTDIMRLRLFQDETFTGESVNAIVAAVRRNVQELDLKIAVAVKVFCELPRQAFRCKSLRKLKFKLSGEGYAEFNIPESVSLHQLNSLILGGITIPHIEFFNSLCSNCPLFELRIIDCEIGNEELNLNIDSLYLKTLELDYVWVPDGSITKLNVPNITSFICKDEMSQEYSLGNLTSLVIADITMSLFRKEKGESAKSYSGLSAQENDIYGKRMIEFLGAVENVKELKLSSGFLEVLSKAPGLLDCQSPILCNLQYLELKVWFTRGCMSATSHLLKISPNLNAIVLTSKESGLPDIEEKWGAGSSLPCILSKLRYVEIREVEGCDNELKLLGFILENAMVVEEVALFFRSTVGSPERVRQLKRFRSQLRALPRASSNINMMFF